MKARRRSGPVKFTGDEEEIKMRPGRKVFSWAVSVPAILGILHFGPVRTISAEPKGTMKIALHYGYSADWFVPSLAGDLPAVPAMYIFHDALIKPMPGNWYAPCVAESWKISPDYKVYEFHLRKGVKFHNGDPLTAEDVVFTFQRYKARGAKLVQDRILKLEAVNPYLFRLTFKDAFPDFLDYLLPGMSTLGFIVPKKYMETVGEEGYKRNPVGCGPYKFVEFKPDVRFVGEAFEGFWRKVPHVKRLEYYIVNEASTRYAMVKRKEVDVAMTLSGVFVETMEKDRDIRSMAAASPTLWIVNITSQWDPKSPWSDPRVRKAASLALDRKTIAETHMPGAPVATSLALDGDPNGTSFPVEPYDPERAKKLLAEAGYPNGIQGGTYYPHDTIYWEYGEMVANYWKAVGIHVESVKLPKASWLAMRRNGKMKGTVFIDPIPQPTIGGRLAHLFGGTFCYGNYPEIEALWGQYLKTADSNNRKELIGRVQKQIYDKTMYIPITETVTPCGVGPRVKGSPFKTPPLAWWPAPVEDLELND